MNIALLDVDSKIPNLALMKIAAWHKAAGDTVSWYEPLYDYDEIFASKIFSFSSDSMIDPQLMTIGGTGYSLGVNLPDEVEQMAPDYSIYRYPHNIGFTMRGCRLRCSFCVVPQKEGRAHSEWTIERIWTQRSSKLVVLLDNDFFGNPQWRDRIEEIKAYRLRVNFSQGINIRNLKPDQAQALASVDFRNLSGKKKQIHFAWDDPRHEKLIRKGIAIATEAGIKPYQMAFYVLIGYHSTPEEDLHRVEVLRGFGCDPFVMPYDHTDSYQRTFARWANYKAIFKSVAWKDYAGYIKRAQIKNCSAQQRLFA